jgi:hypothetical protein
VNIVVLFSEKRDYLDRLPDDFCRRPAPHLPHSNEAKSIKRRNDPAQKEYLPVSALIGTLHESSAPYCLICHMTAAHQRFLRCGFVEKDMQHAKSAIEKLNHILYLTIHS